MEMYPDEYVILRISFPFHSIFDIRRSGEIPI